MNITEAERQVLIALIELSEPIETRNNSHYTFYPQTLEGAARYFLDLREDWQPAYAALIDRGLIAPSASAGSPAAGSPAYCLTGPGATLARQERQDHPPIWYWYRKYYILTAHSPVYSRFCTELYGRDLCQTSFSDMNQIDYLIQSACPRPGERMLDLGCGKGLLAEYISDKTGTSACGIDYVPEAIEQAQERTREKSDRLSFSISNFDHLAFPDRSFDTIISVDTLYMPTDLTATLRRLKAMLKSGGQMLFFYSHFLFDPSQPRDVLSPDGNDLAVALRRLQLPYRTWDFSDLTHDLLQRKHRLAQSMQADFAAEGTLFLYNHLIAESAGDGLPFDPQTFSISRYLYRIEV
jgi:ubiquinone/menaquinone biosynthesis C-methylase UbiE